MCGTTCVTLKFAKQALLAHIEKQGFTFLAHSVAYGIVLLRIPLEFFYSDNPVCQEWLNHGCKDIDHGRKT